MKKCPKCGGKKIEGVEYWYSNPYRYDGISEWVCMNKRCGARFGRWSGKELKGKEQEPPYGKKEYVTSKEKHYNL